MGIPLLLKRAFSGWEKGYGVFSFLISGLCASAQDYKMASSNIDEFYTYS